MVEEKIQDKKFKHRVTMNITNFMGFKINPLANDVSTQQQRPLFANFTIAEDKKI